MSPRAQAPGRRRLASVAQPGLPMTMPAAGPRGRVVTEASTPCSTAFDGDEWLFNVDWEGSRCLLIADADGSIRLQGETATLGERFPEIVGAGRFLAGRGAVLDG
ncbi:MAG: hypothetical protein M3Z57_05485, partial [Candidatus Dormibacteraeota bacterium]|nr:hypothetical protein [Candidatus Dormibacteraeota bacterium]